MLGVSGDPSRVHRCPDCGLIQRFALPDPDSCPEGKRSAGYTAGTTEANPRMLARLRELEAVYGKGPLIDVGAGTGTFVDAAGRLGWDATGIELPGEAHGRTGILEADITREPIPGIEPGSAHIVHVHHVLEHVEDILGFLRACIGYLSPTGILVLEVPNEVRSLAARVRRLCGMKYHSRTAYLEHRYFFTKRVLCSVLSGMELHVLTVKTPFVCHGQGPFHRAFDSLQSLMGMGSCLEVHCRKT
jgi:SAM-dependent methyltransferase